ncbi:MAG: MSMEG_0565 family glycosyltransferase [bacterium]
MSSVNLDIGLFTYSTKPRGGVVHTLNLAEHLADQDQNPHVYALGRRDESAFFRDVSVPTTIVPFEKRDDESFTQRVQRYISRFTEFLAGGGLHEHDLYHSQDCISANALWNLRQESRIPFFVRTIHHVDDFKTQALVDCQDNSITRPDRRIVVSNYWKGKLHEDFGVSASVIPNGVDLNQFRPAPDTDSIKTYKGEFDLSSTTVYLSLSGVEPRKNTKTMLRAFEKIVEASRDSRSNPVWVIAGGKTLFDYRDYREDFYGMLEESELQKGEDVRILGSVSDDELLKLYQLADVLLFPSRKEGFGLVALEAMACDLPVVASTIDVFQEFMTDGENALLVDPDSPLELKEAAIRLTEEGDLREKIIDQGRETAEEYSWENTARRHVNFYRDVLNHMERLKEPFGEPDQL